jgi:hypothetical protein
MAAITNIPAIKAHLLKDLNRRMTGMTRGLKKCGRLLKRESMKIVPIETGNLKASVFIRSENDNTPFVVVYVGYTAAYALPVHENLDALHGAAFNIMYAHQLDAAKGWRRKGVKVDGPFSHSRGLSQQAKFLERPFRRLHDTFIEIMKSAVRK